MKSKKVIFIAKVDSHILHFHVPYLKYFSKRGYTVVVISEGESEIPFADIKIDMTFGTNPFNKNSVINYRKLKTLLNDPSVVLVHTHTAIASAIARLAIDREKFLGKLIYTSHGFHFMKNGSLKNWIYYIPEKLLSSVNDALIVINNEDYDLAKKKFKTKNIYLIPGIGVSDVKIYSGSKFENEKLKEIMTEPVFTITYIGELNRNKNQKQLIKAFPKIQKHVNKKIRVIFVGTGDEEENLKKDVRKLGLTNDVLFLGYQTDIAIILENSDLYCSMSLREGLGLNVIEALLNEVPVVASNIRGHNEIIKHGFNGYLFDDMTEFEILMTQVINNEDLLRHMSKNAKGSVQKYRLEKVFNDVIYIYEKEIQGDKNNGLSCRKKYK